MSDFLLKLYQKDVNSSLKEIYGEINTIINKESISIRTINEIIEICEKYDFDLLVDVMEKLLSYEFNKTNIYKYLSLIKGTDEEIFRLRRITEIDGFFDYEEGVFIVCQKLLKLSGDFEDYAFSLNVIERWTQQLLNGSSVFWTPLQIELISYEYKNRNLLAARNRLRHILSANIKITSHSSDLVYWSIILDVMDNILAHKQLNQILANCPNSYVDVIQSYRYLLKGKVSRKLIEKLECLSITDSIFLNKINCFVLLLRYVLGEKIILSELEEMKSQCEHDVYFQLVLVNIASPIYDYLWESLLYNHSDLAIVLKSYANNHLGLSKPKQESVSIEFLGGGEQIGGTSIILCYKGQKLMLDAGMYLDRKDFLTDFSSLDKSGGLSKLDGVIISHAHLDHIGSLPYIKKVAPQVPIYMTPETNIMFGTLIRTVTQQANMTYYSNYDVICTETDAITKQFEDTFIITGANGIPWHITFYEAGHVLGAAAIYIRIDGNSILFTGDYSLDRQRHCGKLSLPSNLSVDILISESTYGYRPKLELLARREREQLLISSIERTIKRNGSILIPTFAFGRAQEILKIIQSYYKDDETLPFNLILDGNVTQMTQLYSDLNNDGSILKCSVLARNFYSDNASFKEFYDLYVKNGGACIIASSGMLHKGSASYFYAKNMISQKENTIALTGYLDSKSPAATIYQQRYNKGEAVIFGDSPTVIEATIEMHHFSAHVLQRDLISVVTDIKPKRVILMHGEHEHLYNPFSGTKEEAERLYMSISSALQKLKIPYTLAKNGTKYEFER